MYGFTKPVSRTKLLGKLILAAKSTGPPLAGISIFPSANSEKSVLIVNAERLPFRVNDFSLC